MQTVAQRKKELAEAAEAERVAHAKAETVRQALSVPKGDADPQAPEAS